MRQRLELTLQPKLILTPEMQVSLEVLAAPLLELKEMVDRELLENPFLEEVPPPADAYYPEEDELPWWERIPDGRFSLQEHLIQQVACIDCPDGERGVLVEIARHVDSTGLLGENPGRLSKTLGIPLDEFEKCRRRFMRVVDPEGCGALSVEEFIRFQLELRGVSVNGLDEKRLKELVDRYSLKPYPAWGMGEVTPAYVEPDAFVVKVGDVYQVYLNERYTPRLVMNESYRSLLYDAGLDERTQEFLKMKMKRAIYLMKAIEQRNRTLRRTVEAIVELERDFLDKGFAHFRPLKLKDVAERVELHVSTVSRVVNSKYVHTPQGTFSLKFFFEDKGFQIKLRIKQLIESEDKRRPLSDAAIAELLKREGFDIARRTVAKYREELGIPSSAKRRVRECR